MCYTLECVSEPDRHAPCAVCNALLTRPSASTVAPGATCTAGMPQPSWRAGGPGAVLPWSARPVDSQHRARRQQPQHCRSAWPNQVLRGGALEVRCLMTVAHFRQDERAASPDGKAREGKLQLECQLHDVAQRASASKTQAAACSHHASFCKHAELAPKVQLQTT